MGKPQFPQLPVTGWREIKLSPFLWRVGDHGPDCLEQERALKALRGDFGRSRRNQANKALKWTSGSHRQGK